eukprot:gene18269-18531_t
MLFEAGDDAELGVVAEIDQVVALGADIGVADDGAGEAVLVVGRRVLQFDLVRADGDGGGGFAASAAEAPHDGVRAGLDHLAGDVAAAIVRECQR